MSKRNANPRTIKEAEKVLGYHCAEVQEMAFDVARRMVEDQNAWLDGVMKDLLPPELYEAGKREEREEEIAAYLHKHGISIKFIPDTQRIHVLVRGHDTREFRPTFTVDGEPVKLTPQMPGGNQN